MNLIKTLFKAFVLMGTSAYLANEARNEFDKARESIGVSFKKDDCIDAEYVEV